MTDKEYESIKVKCENWAKHHLGDDFKFREYQLDAIIKTINNVIGSTKTQVIEAPTGSGKSLIAMITAGTLDEYYHKSSYILVSDTALFEQYEKDVVKYKLDWGCLCGKDNYMCSLNGLPFSCSRCHLSKVPIDSLAKCHIFGKKPEKENDPVLQYTCARTCKHIRENYKAHTHHVSILTYQLYLLINDDSVVDDFAYAPKFKKRDVIICDEAHKIPDILQSTFSPRISLTNIADYEAIYKYYEEHTSAVAAIAMKTASTNKKDMDYEPNPISDIKNILSTLVKMVSNPNTPKEQYASFLSIYSQVINIYGEYSTYIRAIEKKITKPIVPLVRIADNFSRIHSIIKSYLELDSKYLVVSAAPDMSEVVFHCAKESAIVSRFLHQVVGSEVLMSATIGDVDTYQTLIGCDNLDDDDFKGTVIPSTFDFTKSPIYYNKKLKLSYKEKAQNLPIVVKQIEDILRKHPNEHGIIHTGSFEFSKYLMTHIDPELKKRLLGYNNTTEKKHSLAMFETMPGKVLIGPSMIEGISLDYDKARFLIIMKTPFASLADNLVKAKMDLYPKWYAYDVGAKIIQALGRGVRAKDDWCVSYILDGCFSDLMDRNKWLFDDSVKNRLVRLDVE